MNHKIFLSLLMLLMLALQVGARKTYNFNADWVIDKKEKVTLPHAWNEDESFKMTTFEMSTGVRWYRKTFRLPAEAEGKRVFIEFEGA